MVSMDTSTPNILRTVDLFAGLGGMRLGFERAGVSSVLPNSTNKCWNTETVFANDIDPNAKRSYDYNFKPAKLTVADFRDCINEIPSFDILLAGFPCQPFSIAGHRQGFDDEQGRGNLFFHIADLLKLHSPTGFLLENVRNLVGHDQGRTLRTISLILSDLGYYHRYKVLNTMHYGNIPQNRERIYIVGFKDPQYIKRFRFPQPIPLTRTVKQFLATNVDQKYYYNNTAMYNKLKDHVTDPTTVYQWRRQYVRENKKNVCPTLTANMGTGGHNVPIICDKDGIRKLTPYECLRLQGFDSYALPNLSDSTLYSQIGNSVSVPVIESISNQIKLAME